MLTHTVNNLNQTLTDFTQWAANVKQGWDVKPAPDKWSAKELVGHLIDNAQVNLQRFVRCTYEDGFKLIYFQNQWVAAARYQEADISELIQLWTLLNKQIIRVWQHYPHDRLQVTCDNGRDAVELHTVSFLATDYIEHMQHHLDQIRNLLN